MTHILHSLLSLTHKPDTTHKDHHTWQQQTDQVDKNWEPLISELTDYYLAWKYPISKPIFMEGDIKDANHIEFNIESVDIHTDPQTITI